VQDDRITVFTEKPFTVGHRRGVWGTGGAMAVLAAAEPAFHAHPLGDDDFLGVDPFVVTVSLGLEYVIDGLSLFRSKTHGLLTPFTILKQHLDIHMHNCIHK